MSITTYSALDALLVNNTAHGIRGDDLNNWLDSSFGVSALSVKTAAYTLTESDEVIIAASPGDYSITLPAVASTRVGKRYTIVHGSGNPTAITVVTSGADTIMNGTRVVLVRSFQYVTVVNRGNAWIVIGDDGVFNGIVYVLTNASTISNSVTESSILGTGNGNTTLPIDFYQPYTVLEVEARGYISNTGTPTLRVKVKHGSTILGDTGAVTTASGLSSYGWRLRGRAVCRSVGGSGTVMFQGEFEIASTSYNMPNTAAATIATNATQALGVTVQWGTQSSSNTITCEELVFKVVR